MAIITDISGQYVTFSDGSSLRVPMELTPRKYEKEITLSLDGTTRTYKYDLDVTKKKFIMGINVLMIHGWQRGGRKPEDKPEMILEEGT